MPKKFLVYQSAGEEYGDQHHVARLDIWQRSRGPGPTALNYQRSNPRLLIPHYYRTEWDGPKDYTLEQAKIQTEWIACLKMGRSTLERGSEKKDVISVSSSHRRFYKASMLHVIRWDNLFVESGGKIQVEHDKNFRSHLNRKDPRGRHPYRQEELYEKYFGKTHYTKMVKNKLRLIPTSDEVYRRKFFDLIQDAGKFNDEQMNELYVIWETVADGHVVGSDFDKNLTFRESRKLDRLGLASTLEGRSREVRRKEKCRSRQQREKFFELSRLLAKVNNQIWSPICEICNKSFGPDSPGVLAFFEVSHRNPISKGERKTFLKDLMCLDRCCHGSYTYFEQLEVQVGKTPDCEVIKEAVRNLLGMV